jgi:hypothetical protein
MFFLTTYLADLNPDIVRRNRVGNSRLRCSEFLDLAYKMHYRGASFRMDDPSWGNAQICCAGRTIAPIERQRYRCRRKHFSLSGMLVARAYLAAASSIHA